MPQIGGWNIRADNYPKLSLRALKLGHWAGLVLSAFLACAYVDVVIDQLPCFLGVPNCD